MQRLGYAIGAKWPPRRKVQKWRRGRPRLHGKIAGPRATRRAKHERKLARRAEAAEATAKAGTSTQVLGDAVASGPYNSDIIDYGNGCERYSDEYYEYDNNYLVTDEGFNFQSDPTSPDSK